LKKLKGRIVPDVNLEGEWEIVFTYPTLLTDFVIYRLLLFIN
jgi:hypothetical protein